MEESWITAACKLAYKMEIKIFLPPSMRFCCTTKKARHGSAHYVEEVTLINLRLEDMQRFISRDLYILVTIAVWKRRLALLSESTYIDFIQRNCNVYISGLKCPSSCLKIKWVPHVDILHFFLICPILFVGVDYAESELDKLIGTML